jgi:hypothetical protein
VCNREDVNQCIVDRIYNTSGFWYSGYYWSDGYTFDYFATGDMLAVVQDAFTLAINGEIYDLSSVLDGEIASVTWLPSLFYAD